MTDPERVVLEYEFLGYTPPEDHEAHGLEFRVTHTPRPLPQALGLFDMRFTLEGEGFKRHGAHSIRTRNFGRFYPTWREVWVQMN